ASRASVRDSFHFLILASLFTPLVSDSARAQVRSETGVMIPLRDGVKLATDITWPEAPGRYPVLLARTPYSKAGLQLPDWAKYFASRGYVFAVQDTRGKFASEGKFEFFTPDGKDGFDTIEWLAKQPWSNGKVGTLSLSYLGTVQWLAAREHPPHLVCMAPTAPAGRWLDELPYAGGAFNQQFALHWLSENAGRPSELPNTKGIDWAKVLAHRPLLTADSVLGKKMPVYRDWLEHPLDGPFWSRIRFSAKDFAAITIPTLTTTGWYDGDQPGALNYWRGLMANAPDRSRHFLMIGPWLHIQTFAGGAAKVGDTDLSPASIVDNKAIHLAFFDWCLKGTTPKFDAPRAQVYITGANTWRTFDTYPPSVAAPKKLYLASGGRANTLTGDGRLTWTAPADSPPDHLTFDPKNPVPGDYEEQGLDRTKLQQRPDVLVYTSEAMKEPLEIIGNVQVSLEVASDALDTDFTAILSDVRPDGKAVKLGPAIGIRRARYRNGYTKEELLTPGKAATVPIELFDIGHSFQPGHRIRLEISSSATPAFNPNQNTGNPVATDTVWKVAHQTIYHDRSRLSSMTLPVVSASAVP
ncbi:MAG: CocE/NonD family hydrolase, partial [Gemmatimonadota bacterium]